MTNPAKRIERALAEVEEAMRSVRTQKWDPRVYTHGVAAEVSLRKMAIEFARGPQRVAE